MQQPDKASCIGSSSSAGLTAIILLHCFPVERFYYPSTSQSASGNL